jgi:hypothetical protein
VLAEIGLSDFADLYRGLVGVMSPAEADECELWQLAALLGADRISDDPIDLLAARVEAEKETLAERAAQLPNAQPQDESVDLTAKVMADMGIKLK